MSFRTSALALGAAAILALAPELGAQRTDSQAMIVHPGSGTPCSNSTGMQLGSTSATCPVATLAGGEFSSSATSDAGLRTLSALTSDTKLDGGVYGGAYSAAYSRLFGSLFIAGTPPSGANLVFRFLATLNSGLTNGGNSSTEEQLSVAGSTGSGYYRRVGSAGGAFITSANAAATAGGIDIFLSLGGFTGAYNYGATAQSTASIGNGAATGTIVYANVDAQLTGIDAVDLSGRVLGSASFANDGSATLNVTATPEPASIVLMASGLLAMCAARRRRAIR